MEAAVTSAARLLIFLTVSGSMNFFHSTEKSMPGEEEGQGEG